MTQVREDIRTVEIEARAAGAQRFDPARLADLSLATADGRSVPLDQIGGVEYRPEMPILKRRDRVPTITVRGDIDESLQPPEVSAQVEKALAPIRAALPRGYSIETGAAVEESAKANVALAAVFPMMIVLMLTVIMLQVRSFAATAMVFLTAPLGLVGAGPDAAAVPAAVRVQCDPGIDRTRRHPDAQHADPDRPDPRQSEGWAFHA